MAVETHGIRHVHLLVADHDRSVSFYRQVFGMEVDFRDGKHPLPPIAEPTG